MRKTLTLHYSDEKELKDKIEMCLQRNFCKWPTCTYCNTCIENEETKKNQICGTCGMKFEKYSDYLDHRGKEHPEVLKAKEEKWQKGE